MRSVALLSLLVGLAGPLGLACDSCGGPAARPPTTCSLDDGTELLVGESGPAPDGCNVCLCNSALELVCTLRACDDAGPPRDDAGPGNDAGPDEEPDAGIIDEGPCHDDDDDGYFTCVDPDFPDRNTELDCDDERFHVQPNGIEFPDTPEDDNCNSTNDDWANCGCDGSAANATDLMGAMDLCGDVVAGATKSGAAGQFGIVTAYQNTVDVRLRSRQDEPGAPPVITSNGCMATMSTGDATGPADGVAAGTCTFQGFDEICDLARIDLTLRAPPNASGFAFDFMFLSYEWPEYLCLVFNDTFLANVRTPAVNNGVETNAAFDTEGNPITVNVGFFENPAEWTVPLDGTSHAASATFDACPDEGDGSFQDGCQLPSYCNDADLDVRSGSGSGWLTTSVPIVPGQQDLRLTLRIHDEGDQSFDSIVLLDAFRWLPAKPTLQTAKENR